jgi:hypothetical protein
MGNLPEGRGKEMRCLIERAGKCFSCLCLFWQSFISGTLPPMMIETFPDDIRRLLVRLPYRAGYYISASDKTGGEESTEQEMIALENLVTYYVEDTIKSEFAQEVMIETLNARRDWENWRDGIETFPEECVKVFAFLADKIDRRDEFAFKNNLLEIGVAVAMAYREFDKVQNLAGKIEVYFALLFKRIKALLTGEKMQSFDVLLNISREEKAALNLLADTLQIPYKIG